MERLIIPVFLPELPRRLRRRYEQLLVLAPLFFHDEPYPSDLRRLERTLDRDHFMDAESARDWGLIDRVLSTRSEAELMLGGPAP